MRSPESPQSNSSQIKWVKTLTLVFCFLIIPGILVFLAWIAPAAAQTPKHFDELTFDPLPELQFPDYQRTTLSNGMTIYLMEDHGLPLVSGQSWIKTGSRLEPEDKVGLASITGEVVRTGGTQTHSSDELNQILEQKAASVEVSVGESSGGAGFNALSEDLDTVFGLFAEVLREPAFPEDKIDLAKTQRTGSIQRRNDDPDDIGQREFRRLIYGHQSPYARIQEYDSINRISRDDIQDFYQQYFQPNRIILGVVGDFDSTKMLALIEQKLGDWKSSSNVSDVLPEVIPATKGGTFLIDQPQLTQSTIQIGHLGGQLNEPDVFPLYVMNEVMNSFGGRLFNEVRSRQGLAYSVYGVWNPQYDYPGLFLAGGQTRSEATVPFVQSVKSEIEKFRQSPVSNAELTQAKDAILNSFVFNFDRPAKTLTRLMRYDYYGYPSDFIFKYQKAVKATTAQEILSAAQRNLKPENLVTLVVGNQSGIKPDLGSIDPDFETLEVQIPPPSAT